MKHLNQDLKQSELCIHVRKYNGHSEPYNPEKIKGWLVYALKGSIPEAEVDTIVSSLPVHEGITTSEIQLKLVNACTNRALTLSAQQGYLVDETLKTTEAFLEAARVLYLTIVHKTFHKAFPQLELLTALEETTVRDYLLPVVEFGIAEGLYEQSLLDAANYFADCKVYPSRDNLLPACGLTQLATKYFRTVEYGSELIYRETPTVMYGLMALSSAWALVDEPTPDCANMSFALSAQNGNLAHNLEIFSLIYDNLSQGKNNSPTPMTIGLRTPQEEYASCVLAECPDTMDGIDTMYDIVSKATSARAGLGIQPSAIRPMLAPVKGGSLKHTGLVKFIQAWMRITKATVQNSARGGSATFNISYWHRNYFDLVMLNDPDGEEAVRCKEADYAFHHDGYLMQAALDDRYVALLDPNTNMGNGLTAYETYYSSIEEFYQWVWDNVDSLPDISEAAPYENCKVKAYDILARLALQIFKTGNNYQFFTDNVNEHTPYEEPIKMTNLCVAPDTLVMIKNVGQVPISSVAGTTQKVWNGFNWTEVDIIKTGTNQEMVRVTTKYGKTLVCTPYHTFYLVKHTDNAKRYFGKPSGHLKVTASELYPGAKLMKGTLPTDNVSVGIRLPMAYDNGFFSGDGTVDGDRDKIYLYGEKANLSTILTSVPKWHRDSTRLYGYAVGLKPKFYVPEDSVLLEDKLNWLAGVLDADGTIARNGSSYSIQLTNTNLVFLNRIVAMLEFIGVRGKISLNRTEGDYKLPDGNGGLATYPCRAVYRLLISPVHTVKLLDLGLTTYRLNFSGMAKPSTDAGRFDTIVSVEPIVERMDTYCFKDHTLGLGMFNGILTGQCVEVLEPTHPAEVGDPFSEVALCTLGGIPWGFVTDEEIPKVTKGQLLLLAAVFEKSRTKIPFTSAAYLRRSVGVGAIDVHHYLAKFNLDLTDGSKENLLRVGKIVHDRMELIQFHLIKAAAELARQYTPADYRTKWKKGWLPIDTYKRHELTNHPLNQDWEGLRQYVIESGGLYFSALSAHMPSESSSVIWGFVNGIEPPRDLITDKSSKVLSVLVPVPELATLKYTMAYDVHPDIQLVIAANIQKFSCQGISYNTYIDYSKKPTFTMEEAMDRLFYRPWALGLKTMYYTNFNIENDGERIEIKKEACESGACTI